MLFDAVNDPVGFFGQLADIVGLIFGYMRPDSGLPAIGMTGA